MNMVNKSLICSLVLIGGLVETAFAKEVPATTVIQTCVTDSVRCGAIGVLDCLNTGIQAGRASAW